MTDIRNIRGAWDAWRATAVLALALLACASLWAQGISNNPNRIPDPNYNNPRNFIYDPYGLLNYETDKYVNEQLFELREKTTCEMAVALIKTTGDLSVEDYTYQLFKHWGMGKADKDNGILLLIATDDRKVRQEVGSGAEGVIPDIAAGRIVRKSVIPAMKEGNINQAVALATDEIYLALTNPEVAEELRSTQSTPMKAKFSAMDRDVLWHFLMVIAIAVFLFTLVMFFLDFSTARRRDNYRRAMTWGPHLPTYWWGALFSCGLALPLALAAWMLYRRSRDVTEVCDTCGAKMKKLNEQDDNAFLSAAQDFEEKLGTVDYDVWLCPDCGTVERFPFVERQLKYQKCPECGTIAMNLAMDKVVDEPTATRPGHGERVYTCQFCRHVKREYYEIPKRDAAAAAAAAALAAGILSGRGSSGGGGFGGGFGGGSSSGGGASGGW